jgi:hypothetical protein
MQGLTSCHRPNKEGFASRLSSFIARDNMSEYQCEKYYNSRRRSTFFHEN